ncbi:protein IQ-DOMAIN 14-like [Punica granatum]|uniref:Protein IQ-DOMAIN 14-like n=1 Tax=Punica granatum TaxID=22663 RepID=A0A6P8DRF3_PUNGR|nr:protein IQ-DOMAIN 14-like [Punica granatum]
MEKASRWITNFLLGKKDDKRYAVQKITGPPATPKVRRRWSFGRSSRKEIRHRTSKSVDSVDASCLVAPSKVVIPESQPLLFQSAVISVDVENAAATKIQAVFRGYLARRALWALRGLVKLQALVRGYLVRKQTSAAMSSMRALMSIQVRARVQRVQMAEETEFILRRRRSVHRKFPRDNGNMKVQKMMMDTNDHEICRVAKSRSGYFDLPRFERIERGYTTYYSGDLMSLNQEQQYKECYLSPSAQNTPRIQSSSIGKAKSTRTSFSFEQTDCIDPFVPHYMANTESSKAKARSQSEPKQRPIGKMPRKSKRRASIDGGSPLPIETRVENPASPQVKGRNRENQDSWFIKLYRSRRPLRDHESESMSTVTSQSNYGSPLLAYEPHVVMY